MAVPPQIRFFPRPFLTVSINNIPHLQSSDNCERRYPRRAKKSPCNPSHFVKKFKEAIGAIPGVRVLTPHSRRHTYVSQMQALGVDLATIQSLVGHADIDMTEHYLHVQEPIRQDAIARFSRAFDTGHSDPEPPDGQRGKIIPFPMVG